MEAFISLPFMDSAMMKIRININFNKITLKVNCESLSVFGASLANGGTCPTTGEEVRHYHHHHRQHRQHHLCHHLPRHLHDNHHQWSMIHHHPDFGPQSCSRCAQSNALLWDVQLQRTVCFQSDQHDDDKDNDDDDDEDVDVQAGLLKNVQCSGWSPC